MKKEPKKDVFKEVVDEVVEAFGGLDNLSEVFHCATRLRVIVKDDNLVNKDKLNNINKSKGYSKEGNQWQIIFGTGIVNKVYDKYSSLYKVGGQTEFKDKEAKKFKWDHNYSNKTNFFLLSRYTIRNFADIFIPLIPLFVAGGLSLALKSAITAINADNSASVIFEKIFDIIGGAIMGSLPVFIGFTSAKKWGGNPWFGAAIGMILVSPSLASGYSLGGKYEYYELWTQPGNAEGVTYIPMLWDNGIRVFDFPIFGIPLIGYQAQVIPTLFVVAIMVWIEKGLKKISHESFAIISVPLGTILFTTIIAFAIVGPLGYVISLAIARGLESIFIYTNFPFFGLGGAILGAVYAPIVVTGLHQGFLPIEATLIAQGGESWITPIACVSNVAQGFACFAAAICVKEKKTKGVAYSGAVSANLGITEPAMFGINISIKHYFLGAIIGSAVGGYWLGMTQTTANSQGSASWLGLIQYDFTTDTPNLVNWYSKVASYTPWGHYMNGFNIPPIANAAIAMTLSSIVAFSASVLLTLSKQGKANIKEANKGEEGYLFLDKSTNAMIKITNKITKTFGELFLGKTKYNKLLEDKKVYYIYSPMDGVLLTKDQIDDPVFKEELMGKTFVIRPDDKTYANNKLSWKDKLLNKKLKENSYQLSSPIKGSISSIFETGHAITIGNKENNFVLIHIGLETAKLNTNVENLKKLNYFKYKKLISSNVNKKSDIVTIESQELINQGAKSNDVFVTLLNESVKENQKIEFVGNYGEIKKGEPIFKVSSI